MMNRIYSHLGGSEFLILHRSELWKVLSRLSSIQDLEQCKSLGNDRISFKFFGEPSLKAMQTSLAQALYSYRANEIDVAVCILPIIRIESITKVNLGFEAAVEEIHHQGRGVPSVPLVLIGIEP